jgi:hypothetical protein
LLFGVENRTSCILGEIAAGRAAQRKERPVAAIISIERRVLTLQPGTGLCNSSPETALYLSNRPIRAPKGADAVRKQWGIENKQHYTRDVTLGEDASRIRRNPGMFARVRSFA